MTHRLRNAPVLAGLVSLVGALGLLTPACESSDWQRYDTPTEIKTAQGLRITTPAGWIRHEEGDGAVHLTRDGFALQRISAYALRPRTAGDAPLTADDVARALEAEIHKRTSGKVELLDTRWERGAERQGVRLQLRSEWKRSADRRHHVYGLQQGSVLVVLEYDATDLYYFDRDLAAFETIVESAGF
jgi:hypothetical protein